jgi:hypothetical protein
MPPSRAAQPTARAPTVLHCVLEIALYEPQLAVLYLIRYVALLA